MEDQPVATKHCSNCKRDVAEGNFVMHEIHCRKNIVLCSKCKEPVPKTGLEEHIEEYHALVNCELCSCLVERSRLDDHKGSLCSKRCQVCAFCELSVPADELGKHESYCGTRTDACAKCLQYIMYKDRIMHEDSNCRLPERIDSMPKADADLFDLPEYSHFDHPDYWSDYPSFAREVQRDDVERSRHERLLPVCLAGYHRDADARQNRLQLEKQAREDKLCDDFLKFALAKKSNAAKDSKVSRDVHSNLPPHDESLLPCEFCDEVFPSDEIVEHQVICGSQFDEPEFQAKRDYGSNLLSDHAAEPLPPKSSFLESANDDTAMLLPCEFCEDLYPTEDLMFHQMNCDVRQLIDARGHEDFPEDMRRPPSLPSGLDQVDNINSIPSPLKPSSSIPLRLSQLAMAHSQPSVPRKPAPAAGAYRHRVPAPSGTRPLYKPPSNLVKKQTVKPPALEDRAGLAGRELSTGAVGSIPLGQDMVTVQSVSLQQGWSLAPRSNARGALYANQHAGFRGKPTSVTDISTSTSAESNHSRAMATRPTGANRADQLTTRPALPRQEAEVSGRSNYPVSRLSTQKKNSRTLPDAPSKS